MIKLIPVFLFLLLSPVMGVSASNSVAEPVTEIVQETETVIDTEQKEVINEPVMPTEPTETEETEEVPNVDVNGEKPPIEEVTDLEKEETDVKISDEEIPIGNSDKQNNLTVSDNSAPQVLQELQNVTTAITDMQDSTEILVEIQREISITNFLLSFMLGLLGSILIMYRLK